jgi:hypothetical protein
MPEDGRSAALDNLFIFFFELCSGARDFDLIVPALNRDPA